jgi:adenine-specific DNA-methyltransferase
MARPNYRDLTHEQLVSLLEARDRKKFGLVWERDAIEADRALNSDFVALDEMPELGAGDGVKPNLIIEGDNFDALRALKVAYAGKVKCIYIDPPYNTGNRDFVYNDRFVDKDHNWRHSLWLEFMFQRLTLARDLLAQDGAIFVSIDDNEIFHLGLLMNEVFGEDNFLAAIAWEKRYTRSNNANMFYSVKDTILAYRCSSALNFLREPRTDKSDAIYKNPDNDSRGVWTSASYVNPATKAERPNLVYPITNPNTGEIVEHPTHAWKFAFETHREHVVEKRLWWGKDGKAKLPRLKVFPKKEGAGLVPIDIWKHDETGTTDDGGLEVKKIFGQAAFTNPKPTRLIERILQIATNPGDLVLDFFAGSGTTGHAVLKMNAANPDQAPRRFILVSNTEATVEEPEKNLCRDVCRQRVANVISGYGDVPGTGGAFAYLRTRRIPLTRVVRRIEHAQVWLFLQLMHFGDLAAEAPLASGRLHARRTPEQTVFYPTTLTEAILQRLDKEREHAANVTIYTWQQEALATRMESPGISILPIPQTLIDRFGPRP